MRTAFNAMIAAGAAFAAVLAAGVVTTRWDIPPPEVQQIGYRGVGMEQVNNPRTAAALALANVAPKPLDPVPPGGQPARTAYKNVKVLGDLSEDQFIRLMTAITEWVSPDEGCAYCHNIENLADDSVYTKIVSRRMLQMVSHINGSWTSHVGQTGVTCYTCHRGRPVPSEIWFDRAEETREVGMLGRRDGQNAPSPANGYTSMLNQPASLLDKAVNLRVVGTDPMANRAGGATLATTEGTYSLMMSMSRSLGVNCTFCHNSRVFSSWEASTPQRTTAWHGIGMVRNLNATYLDPLKATYPANRLGPLGDAPKANCTTCHMGVSKPLYGAQMAKDYPELQAAK